jgi:hypothetical protein
VIAVTVITAAGCPHCAAALARLVRCARARDAAGVSVAITVTDVAAAGALTARWRIRSVPAAIVEDAVLLVGDEVLEGADAVLDAVGTPRFATERLRSLLGSGQVEEVAAELRRGEGAAIIPLLEENALGSRVGVLLALQLAHEAAPGCLAGLVPALVGLLGRATGPLRGDLADLLGTLGDARARAPLAALAADPDPDVAEAAAEALGRLGRG